MPLTSGSKLGPYEILDLIAYLQSGGKKDAAAFNKK